MIAFEPCPICGRNLSTERNLYFIDIEGEMMYELERVTEFDDIAQDKSVNMSCSAEYVRDLLDNVDKICVDCRCGYSLFIDANLVGFPDKGWLDKFKIRANRRATKDAGLMLMPVFHGKSSEYPLGAILDQEDIEYIVSEKLTSNQVIVATLTYSDLTKDDLEMFSDEELREEISRLIAKKIYNEGLKPLRIGDDTMDAEYFDIWFEDVKGWS